MKDYKGLDIHGTSDPFTDWFNDEHGAEENDSDELDIPYRDDRDEY